MATETRHVYEIYIRTTVARLWDAITRLEVVKKYYYGMTLEAELRPGAPLRYLDGRKPVIVGRVVSVVPRKKFVHTFQFVHNPKRLEPPSRVTYEISNWRGAVVLTLIHDRLARSPRTSKAVKGGWGPILSGLKTLLETGKPLFR